MNDENKPKRTRVMREVGDLETKLKSFSSKQLSVDDSFYTYSWSKSLSGEESKIKLDKMNSSDENVSILLKRLEVYQRMLMEVFNQTSEPFFGKTTNLSLTFNQCLKKIEHKDNVCVMLTLELFNSNDIPEDLKLEWDMDVNILTQLYTKLLVRAKKTREDADSLESGRVHSSKDDKSVYLYAMFTCTK
jgi:hypothetical protein